MPWTWPQLDSNFRRKQISGHYSKVRHISKPISSCFFVTDVEQNLQETADGAIPEIIPIHFNYAQFSTQPATSNHSKFEGCCTQTKFLIGFIKNLKKQIDIFQNTSTIFLPTGGYAPYLNLPNLPYRDPIYRWLIRFCFIALKFGKFSPFFINPSQRMRNRHTII